MMDAFHRTKKSHQETRPEIEFELSSFPVLEQTGNRVGPNHSQNTARTTKRVSAKSYLRDIFLTVYF